MRARPLLWAAAGAAAGYWLPSVTQPVPGLRPPFGVDDLARAEEAIAAATGVAPILYRPPYGILTAAGLAVARRRGWRTFLWRRWGRDWAAGATPETIAERLTAGVRPRDVLLLHDSDAYSASGSWRRTVAALPAVFARLEE